MRALCPALRESGWGETQDIVAEQRETCYGRGGAQGATGTQRQLCWSMGRGQYKKTLLKKSRRSVSTVIRLSSLKFWFYFYSKKPSPLPQKPHVMCNLELALGQETVQRVRCLPCRLPPLIQSPAPYMAPPIPTGVILKDRARNNS